MIKNINTKKGFTLLAAIVTTSMLLLVSFVVSNVALKQLVISYFNQESQFAFYNADSGIECATYWDLKTPPGLFDPYVPAVNVSCSGQSVAQVRSANASYATSSITINLPKGCFKVDVVKTLGAATTTKIDSRGYNNCVANAFRKVERGVTITYQN